MTGGGPAAAKPLPDVVAPGLDVLFCGINPSLLSAERGHHFARPGNRFWPALHLAGLTPRRLDPAEDRELLRYRLGVTNVVDRPSRRPYHGGSRQRSVVLPPLYGWLSTRLP